MKRIKQQVTYFFIFFSKLANLFDEVFYYLSCAKMCALKLERKKKSKKKKKSTFWKAKES